MQSQSLGLRKNLWQIEPAVNAAERFLCSQSRAFSSLQTSVSKSSSLVLRLSQQNVIFYAVLRLRLRQNMHTLSFLRFDMRYYFLAVVASEPSNVLDSNTGREGLRVGEIDVEWSVVAAIEELLFRADATSVLSKRSLRP